MAEAGQRLDEQLALVGAQLAIGVDDAFQRAGHVISLQAGAGNIADRGLLICAATEGNLIEFLTLLVDAQNTDMADLVDATGLDTAGNNAV